MNILAIDTTNTNAHIVAQINNVNHYKSMSSQEKHSEHLLLNIENVLSENNIELNDIDILGVVLGPGSFTGIRIGIATIKAFSFALKHIKLVGKNIFELLKNYIKDGVLLINCTKTSVYYGRISNSEIESVGVCDINNVIDNFKDFNIFVIEHADGWYTNLNVNYSIIKDYDKLLLNEFSKLSDNSDFASNEDLKPFYIQLSQAERNLEKGNLNENL